MTKTAQHFHVVRFLGHILWYQDEPRLFGADSELQAPLDVVGGERWVGYQHVVFRALASSLHGEKNSAALSSQTNIPDTCVLRGNRPGDGVCGLGWRRQTGRIIPDYHPGHITATISDHPHTRACQCLTPLLTPSHIPFASTTIQSTANTTANPTASGRGSCPSCTYLHPPPPPPPTAQPACADHGAFKTCRPPPSETQKHRPPPRAAPTPRTPSTRSVPPSPITIRVGWYRRCACHAQHG